MNFVFDKKRPPLVAMVQNETVEDALNTITDALYDGADAFGIQLEDLLPQYRNLEDLKKIFAACMGKPTYITSYRSHNSKGYTDEQCMELLLLGAEAGGDLCDIMGDTFDPQPYEMTFNEEAIAKQKAVIDRIHAMGKQVLISTHTRAHLDPDTILSYAHAQKAHGADVVKIVNMASGRDGMEESMNVIFRMRKELGETPFLYLTGGDHASILRQTGPLFGVCMYLCAPKHERGFTRPQPLLRSMRQVRDNLLYWPE